MSRLSELRDERLRPGPRRIEAARHLHVRALFALLTLIALVAMVLGVLPMTGTARVYLLVVVALAALLAVQTILARLGRLERAPRRKKSAAAGQSPPLFFQRAERRLELASASAAQFEHLRPELRAIADQRLAARGLRFESEQARELLGSSDWRLLERAPEGDKFAPGPKPAELSGLIGKLERI